MSTPAPTLKRSPRAPSVSLKDAVERALRAYDRERLHEAPTEVVAQNIGYKNANSGTALSTIASLRYFGLLTRTRQGFLAVTKDLEAFKYAPAEPQKQNLLVEFLTKPSLYQELLKKYATGLPSDATLRYELINRGFAPPAAETALSAFKESVEFAKYFQQNNDTDESLEEDLDPSSSDSGQTNTPYSAGTASLSTTVSTHKPIAASPLSLSENTDEHDQIFVRLSGSRRAWLLIPSPFYKADKVRLKAQIDLLLTEDEDSDEIN